jgi:hypothetical protein
MIRLRHLSHFLCGAVPPGGGASPQRNLEKAPVEPLPAQMAAVAADQHALITLDQLADLKVSRHQRERLLATGQIVRVANRVSD